MKRVDMYLDKIKDELDGAMDYAEKYISYKTDKPQWSRMYGEMATDELKHAEYAKSIAQQYIDGLAWAPEEVMDQWNHCVAHYGEKVALIKLMLSK